MPRQIRCWASRENHSPPTGAQKQKHLQTQSREVITSLAFALKNAIQISYQLEDGELAAELLPDWSDPRTILLYESAEGGAGVLRRLLADPAAFPRIAREALNLCHFDPDTGEDRHRAPGSTEDCEAACYDCLLSYSNQLQHPILDRKAIKDVLLEFQSSTVVISPAAKPRATHLAELKRLCGSKLEEGWLDFLEANDCRLPSSADSIYNQPAKLDGPSGAPVRAKVAAVLSLFLWICILCAGRAIGYVIRADIPCRPSLVAVILPYSPLAGALGFVSLPVSFLAYVAAATITYLVNNVFSNNLYRIPVDATGKAGEPVDI